MKKIFTLAIAVLLCLPTFAQSAVTVPFVSDISGPVGNGTSFVDGWKQIDANNDNSIWNPFKDGNIYCARYNYKSTNPGDDYLVSPAISFEAGKEYKIIYSYRSHNASYQEAFEVFLSAGETPAEILAGNKIGSHEDVRTTSYTQVTYNFTPEESSDLHLVFHCISPKDKYYLYVAGVMVVEDVFTPSPATNLTATAGENRAMSCALTWELPTTDIFGEAFPEGKTIEKVEVFRDGGATAIATLAGDATSFTDTAETGLTSGYHSYTVAVTVDGATATSKAVYTTYVGPIAPTDVPATISIASANDFELWTAVSGTRTNTGASAVWRFYDSSDICARYDRAYQKTEDDWLITPPLNFAEAGAYKISFDVKTGYNSPAVLECYFGASADTTDMQLRQAALPVKLQGRQWGSYYVNVTTPGTYYAALRAVTGAANAQYYEIFSVKVEESVIMPQAVTQLVAAPVGSQNKAKLSFFLSDKSNTDEDITADNVQVKIYTVAGTEETLVKTVASADLTLGAVNEVEVDVPAAGIYTFKVVTANAADQSIDYHPTILTSWIGDKLVELPYSIDLSASTPDETVNIWSVIDANGDEQTWKRESYYGFRCYYPETVDGVQQYNDYLLTPEFDLEPGYYMVRYQIGGGSYNAETLKYNIGYTTAGSYSATSLPVLQNSKLRTTQDSSVKDAVYTFQITTAGRYQIVFAATDANEPITNEYRTLTVKKFNIDACQVLPELATGLTITADPDKELKATLTWTNPTGTNIEGLDLAADELVKAVILRDGEAVATVTEGLVPGETTTYTDEMEQGGVHAYAVEIYNANGKSEANATVVASPWIGGGLQTPYTADSYLAFSQWDILNANNDTDSYGDPRTWRVESNKAYAGLTSTSSEADDYIISPIIDIKPGSIYKVETTMHQANSSSYYSYATPFQLLAGTGDDVKTYTKVATFTLAKEANSSNKQTDTFYVLTYAAPAAETGDETAEASTLAKAPLAKAEGEETEGEQGEEVDYESLAKAIADGNVHFALRCIGIGDLMLDSFTVSYVGETTATPPAPGEHVCEGAALPYIADFATASGLNPEWTVKDGNNDSKTWAASTDSYGPNGYAAKYTYHSSNDADDYLISKLFHFEGGKEYKIFYTFHGSSNSGTEKLSVYVNESNIPGEIKGEDALKTITVKSSSIAQEVATFAPAQSVDAYVAFRIHSAKNQYGFYLNDVSVLENKFSPKPVGNLKAVPAPLREIKVNLSWDLPTESAFGDPFTADQTIEQIEIFRDEETEAIATLDGTATSFSDTEELGLTAGKHTYTVVVTVAGETAAAQVGPTSYVGPVQPVELPVSFVVTDADEASTWSTVAEETSTVYQNWEYYCPNSYSTPAFRTSYYAGQTAKEWLIAPPVTVAEAGYYRATVKAKQTDKVTSLIGVVGTALDLSTFTELAHMTFTSSFAEQSFDFYAAEAGTYYVGVLVDSEEAPSNNTYDLTTIAIAASEFTPAPATEFTATGVGQEEKVVLSWKNSANDLGGQPIVAENYKLEIYRNDELVKTIEGTELATDGTFNTYTDEVPEAGIYTYELKAVSTSGASAPSVVKVKTAWIGSHVVALPYDVNLASDVTNVIWEAVDANADGITWKLDTSAGFKLEPEKDANGNATFCDYLLSPYFALEPGYYKFSYEIRGGNYSTVNPYTVGLFEAGTFNAEAPEFIAQQDSTVNYSSYNGFRDFSFEITEAGTYQIAVGSNVTKAYVTWYTNIDLRKVKMAQTFVLPKAATSLTITPAADKSLQATISWVNPTLTNVEGVELAEGDIVKAVIVRDGEEVATVTEGLVPGAASSFVDNTLTQAGIHSYSVDIYNANGKNEENSPYETSTWIGDALLVPYQANSYNEFSTWTFVNVNDDYTYGDPICWKAYRSSSREYLEIVCTSKVADDWAITPPIKLQPNTIYEVEIQSGFYSSYNSNPDQHLTVAACESGEYTDMETLYTIDLDTNTSATASNYKTDTFLLVTPGSSLSGVTFDDFGNPVEDDNKIEISAGNKYFGIYAGAKGDIVIPSFRITSLGSATGIDSVVAKDGVVFANGTLSFEGTADINVFNVAGALVATAQAAEGSFSLDNLASGVYMVSLTFENGKSVVLKVVK